jgi:hypothetical protein
MSRASIGCPMAAAVDELALFCSDKVMAECTKFRNGGASDRLEKFPWFRHFAASLAFDGCGERRHKCG